MLNSIEDVDRFQYEKVKSDINFSVSILPIVGSFIALVFRLGFENQNLYCLGYLGISLFLMHSPSCIIKILRISPFNWYSNEMFFTLLFLLVFLILGRAIPMAEIIFWLIAFFGFLLFFVFARLQTRFNAELRAINFFFIVISVLLGVYVFSTIWANLLSPTFLESLSTLKADGASMYPSGDTLYHMSYAQMIKNYKIPSTGLNGVPFLQYHFGSHWIFAQLSKFSGFPMWTCYSLGYPLIFVPLFLKSVLILGIDIQKFLVRRPKMSLWGLICFFCIFLRIPDHRYAGGYNQVHTLIHESQIISLFLFFAVISISIYFWQGLSKKDLSRTEQSLFLFFALPFLFTTLGLVKISTLFVLLGIFGFVIIYLRLFNVQLIGATLLVVVSSSLTYWFTVETIPFGIRETSPEGVVNLLSFYKGEVIFDDKIFSAFDWFLLFFMWSYLFALIYIIIRAKTRGSNNYSPFPVYLILITISLGILPGLIFQFYGGNAIFFASIQMYLVAALFIAYGEDFNRFIFDTAIAKKIRVILFFAVGCSVIVQVYNASKSALAKNLITRVNFFENGKLKKSKLKIDMNLFFHDYSKEMSANAYYSFIKKLVDLESSFMDLKGNSLLYVKDEIGLLSKQECVTQSFIYPSLTGFARIRGKPKCNLGNYGDYSYPNSSIDNNSEWLTIEVLKRETMELGFKNLLYFDVNENDLDIMECSSVNPHEGVIVHSDGEAKMYYIENGKKRYIKKTSSLNRLRSSGIQTRMVDEGYLKSIPMFIDFD